MAHREINAAGHITERGVPMSASSNGAGGGGLQLAEYRGGPREAGEAGGQTRQPGTKGKKGPAADLPMSMAGPFNPWLIAVIVSIATFMEVLDTSIANVALRYIAGGLAASQSQSTWVLTSYLASNAIFLPISGWLSSVMGRKKFYMGCVGLFTASSMMCGLSGSLAQLVFWRILQGIGGGGLGPITQTILRDSFPASKIGPVFSLYSLVVVVGPAVGPVLGGWIVLKYSWHWVFLINVPVGILMLLLCSGFLTTPPAEKRAVRKKLSAGFSVDYLGFGLLALSMGTLQVVLDRGQQDDWFGSDIILTLTVLCVLALIGLVVREFLAKEPIVDLRLLLGYRNFLVSCMIMFFTFFILLSTTQLIPQLVQDQFDYNAFQSGLVVAPGAMLIAVLLPIVGFLVGKIEARWLIALGLLLEAAAIWHMTGLDLNASFESIIWYRVWQAAPLALLIVPINTIAFVGLPTSKSADASSLLNFFRNIGGSFGVSFGQTMITRRSEFHQSRLISHLTPMDETYRSGLAEIRRALMATGAGAADASNQAVGTFYKMVQTQATMMSYLDVFYWLSLSVLALAPLCLLLKKDGGGGGAESGGGSGGGPADDSATCNCHGGSGVVCAR